MTVGANSKYASPNDGLARVPLLVYEGAGLYPLEQERAFRCATAGDARAETSTPESGFLIDGYPVFARWQTATSIRDQAPQQ